MTNDEFNEYLQGALSHPMPMFQITRLALCLKAVVEAGGHKAEIALKQWCAEHDRQDHLDERY
jgi:hypothetical protein